MSIIDPNDIKLANTSKTAVDLTMKWTSVFSKYLLNSTEQLSNDPASSINLLLHLTGQSAAKAMYEQQMRINELHLNTAILPKSLVGNLNDSELAGIYGLPASTTIAFCIPKEEIINNAVEDTTGDPTLRKLVLNKNMLITFDGYPSFTLPYDVVINVKQVSLMETDPISGTTSTVLSDNIFANYDIPLYDSGVSSLYNISSPNIDSRQQVIENEFCVVFFIKCFQMVRSEFNFVVTDPATAEFKMMFDNSLIGFEVFKQPVNTSTYNYLPVGFPEGTYVTETDGYNYNYDYKQSRQNLNVSFNKSLVNTLSTGDEIKVIIYSTHGDSGNIEFPNMIDNLDQLIITLSQDLNIQNQNRVLNFQSLAFSRDSSSTGGRNQMTMSELRSFLINKRYSGNKILITKNEIVNKASELGLNVYKERHDIIAMYWRAIDKLVMDGMILSTGMNDFEFGISDNVSYPDSSITIDTIEPIEGKDPNIKLIKPSDVFQYSGTRFHYVKDPVPYNTYVEDYKTAVDPETELQAQFPYFIMYRNTTNPKIEVYDMAMNDTHLLSYTHYDENVTLDKMDISSLIIKRNPVSSLAPEAVFNEKDPKNIYYIYFNVYTSGNSLNRIQSELDNNIINDVNNTDRYIMFRIKITEINNSGSTYEIPFNNVKIMEVNTGGYFVVRAQIETDNYITDERKINILSLKNNSSIYETFNPSALIDTTVKFSIEGIFANTGNVPSIIYETEFIELVKYRTDQVGIDFDIKTGSIEYERYTTDKIKTYENAVYEPNPNYNSVITETDNPDFWPYLTEITSANKVVFIEIDGKQVPSFIIKYKQGDPVILHHIGDEILDENGNPVLDENGLPTYYTEDIYDYEYKIGDIVYENGKQVILDTTYIGVLKNVSWTNRLYFNNYTYPIITDLYKDLIDRIEQIKLYLFDGGVIYGGLAKTSGHSSKYKAFNLTTQLEENLLNIALSIEYKVKFKENLSVDYKKSQIINLTVSYIESLGDNVFSVDNLFEYIKSSIDDIEYINILKLNQYTNGQVQTILNDPNVTNEVLTISQKVDDTTNIENGIITFIPDITVKVVGIDDI